jgi:hypothetical protein
VKCESPVDGKFTYFAASATSDPRFAARALSIVEAAQLGDKYLNVLFDPNDQSGQAYGCALVDCRPLLAVVLRESYPDKCEIDVTQPGCPGFCAATGDNDPTCPGFCRTHDTIDCPGYCKRHPNDLDCKLDSDRCRNAKLPGCL